MLVTEVSNDASSEITSSLRSYAGTSSTYNTNRSPSRIDAGNSSEPLPCSASRRRSARAAGDRSHERSGRGTESDGLREKARGRGPGETRHESRDARIVFSPRPLSRPAPTQSAARSGQPRGKTRDARTCWCGVRDRARARVWVVRQAEDEGGAPNKA